MNPEILHHFPQFLWRFWLAQTGPTNLPRDNRVHIYDVYDNDLSEIREPPLPTTSVFSDFNYGGVTTRAIVRKAEHAFYLLESKAEATLTSLIEQTYSHGTPTIKNSFIVNRMAIDDLCKYLVFLRFRNSMKYREIVHSLEEPVNDAPQDRLSPIYIPLIIELRRRHILRAFIAFLEPPCQEEPAQRPRLERHPSLGVSANAIHDTMELYCWRLCGADVCIGIASDEQQFVLTDSCFGTLDEGFEEDPGCSDMFFPILPTLAIYVLGNGKGQDDVAKITTPSFVRIEVGIESASDIHLRNAMILQTYPRRLYFSALRAIALSISSYDEFRWIQEHQDYSRLKQRCRQKFLQETVTKTLVIKGSVILTDLTDEITPIGKSAVFHGAFSDVWKGTWNDPVEKRPCNVALKILRQIMVQNVREKLMKRLQAEVIAWHKLSHRNISQLYGIIQFQSSIGMVSPWCDNGTLCHYLKGNTTTNRLDLLVQIAAGVAYLHTYNPIIIHGDLKGGNILVDQHGCPVITDFGLSKVIEDMSDSIDIGSSFFAGSTRWMAPELILALVEDDGHVPPITTHSDVYAFASVCLEVATDHIPYPHRTNDHAVTVDILRGVKPSRDATCYVLVKDEEMFWSLLDRCWDLTYSLRPTMPEVHQLLEGMGLAD